MTPKEARAEPAAAAATADGAVAQGKQHLGKADWGKAVAAFSEALALEPGNLKALAGRGQALFELKKTGEAVKDLQAVLAASPNHPQALLILGTVAQEQGRKTDARDYYQRYLRRYPSGRRAWTLRRYLGSSFRQRCFHYHRRHPCPRCRWSSCRRCRRPGRCHRRSHRSHRPPFRLRCRRCPVSSFRRSWRPNRRT
jgi:tetratricopeptide (TPR) repeat protein